MPMTQVTRQDEDAIESAFGAGQPALQYHRSHGMAKIMQTRWAAMERNALSQSAERPLNGARGQTTASLRDEEVLSKRKLLLATLILSPQWANRCRMQGN